jgi:hypothetical protein
MLMKGFFILSTFSTKIEPCHPREDGSPGSAQGY